MANPQSPKRNGTPITLFGCLTLAIVLIGVPILIGLVARGIFVRDDTPSATQSVPSNAAQAPSITSPAPSIAPEKSGRKWYSGGTLHQSTGAEWTAATSENQLATCGDWLATARTKLKPEYTKKFTNIDSDEAMSMGIVLCDQMTIPLSKNPTQQSSLQAAIALDRLGWLK
jgi:hypothetical protein